MAAQLPARLPVLPIPLPPSSLPVFHQPPDTSASSARELSYRELRNRHRILLVEARRLKQAATKDALTGVLNRRALDEALLARWQRYQDGAPAFGIILCDIDHFKTINDTYGHAAGDQVLAAAAPALAAALRGDDQFGRYGGEEFLAIVDTDSVARLRDVSERLRLRLSASTHGGLRVTASFGAAVATGFESLSDLLAASDRALYAAKARGRDRSIVWTDGRPDALVSSGDVAARERLGGALGGSMDGMLVVDADGRIVQWNDAITRICDLSPATLATSTLAAIEACLPAASPAIELPDAEAGRAGAGFRPPVRFVTSPDNRTFERRTQPFGLGPGRDGWLITFREVDGAAVAAPPAEIVDVDVDSDRRRHALRMESVGRLAGGIAHDFNNLLTAMIGYAEVLEEEVGPRESLREVLHAARSAADLTRQLLAFSRQQRLEPRVVNVSSVVAGLGALVGRLIGDDVRLVIDAPDNLPNVCADPAQLEQIVVNLAINARDAMPRGGDLFVRVRPHVLGRPRPGREVQPPGEYVQIVVEDTGEGIRPELLPRVFEPFFTTKGLQGTGLGLSTVYGIVKQSGGFIWIESEVGKGTTFTIDFPVATDDAPVAAIAETTPPPQGVPGGRILVVEDQENVRVLTRELLESAGYEVIASATPHEALQLATSGDRPIDLVLTDVTMPGMTGAELAAAIRAERPGLPVLFMSGLPKALESDGPGPILAKPFTRASLIAHVSGPGATSA